MKILYAILLISLSIFTTRIDAQAIDLDSLELIIQEVIPVKNQGFVVYKADHSEQPFVIELSYFDANMKLVNSHKMPVYKAGEVFTVENILVWQGQLILHAAHYLEESKKNQLFQYTFNLPNLKLLSKKLVLLSKAPDEVYVPFFSSLSPDKTKLVMAGWDYNKRKDKAYIRIRIIDENFKEIRRQTFLIPFENRRLSIEEVFVTNNGEAYITGNSYEGSLLALPKPRLTHYFVVGLFDEDKHKLWEIEKANYSFQGFRHTISPQGNLIGLGLCIKNGSQGSALYTINPSTKTVITNTQSIDNERFTNAFSKNTKYITPPSHTFKNYQLNQIVRKSDAYYLIAEHDGGYSLKDILVIKLDLQGNIVWSSRIPKAQDSVINLSLVSYALLERKEKFYFLFNDDSKNYQLSEVQKIEPAILPKVCLAAATMDLDSGELKRRRLKNVVQEDYIFLPNLCHMYAKEKALIMSIGIRLNAGKINMKKIQIPE